MPSKNLPQSRYQQNLWVPHTSVSRERGRIFKRADYTIEYKYVGPLFGIDYENLADRIKIAITDSGLPRIDIGPLKVASTQENRNENYVTRFKNSNEYAEIIFGDKRRPHQATTDLNGKISVYLRNVSPKFCEKFTYLLDRNIQGFGPNPIKRTQEEI